MYQSINLSEFRSAFHNMGRGDQFSYEGLEILFEGLENTDGEEMQLDVIAFCCDFSEDSEDIIRGSYSHMLEDDTDIEEFLNDNTWVLGSHEKDGSKYFIYQQF
jgi:hypothetical protein